MSWNCPNDDNDFCRKLKKPCSTAQKGCVLEGKVSRATDDDDAPKEAKKKRQRKNGLVSFSQTYFDHLISWVGNPEALVAFAGDGFVFPLDTDQLEVFVADPRRRPFVWLNNAEPVAFADLMLDEDGWIRICHLLVAPHQRRKGFGRKTLVALIQIARRRFAKRRICLNVFIDNDVAISLYASVGFEKADRPQWKFVLNDRIYLGFRMILPTLP